MDEPASRVYRFQSFYPLLPFRRTCRRIRFVFRLVKMILEDSLNTTIATVFPKTGLENLSDNYL